MKSKILMGLCLFSTMSAYAAGNLIDNPGFESSLNSWTKTGMFSAVKDAQSGLYSARGGTGQGTLVQDVMSKLTIGGKYTLGMYAKLDSMGVSSMMSIRFKNARGGILQENRMVVGTIAWKQYSTTFTVPAGSTIAEVFAIKETGASSYMYIDTLSLISLDPPLPPPNVAPAIIGSQIVSGVEDTALTFNVGAGTDFNGDALTYTKLSNPASGTLTCDGGSSRTCVYTPVQNFNGTVSFTYKANDGKLDSNVGTVAVNIVAVNDAPVLPIAAQSVGTAGNTAVNFALSPATDIDSTSLSYSIVTNPSSGTLACIATACTYTPVTGYFGTTSFTYKANDGKADSNVATVTLTVVDTINNAPVIGSATQSYLVPYNTAVSLNLLPATDADGNALTYSIAANPSSGAVVCNVTACTYTPAAGFSGTTSFTYKANDGQADSNIATVTIVVAASIPAPTVAYSPRGVGGGGAMSGVSLSPYANLWFVGTDMGTLFKSTDLGQSWNAVNHNQAVYDSDLTKAVSVGFSSDGVTVFHASAGITPKRSTNSGDTFTAISMGLSLGELIKYWLGDSANANIMYAGTTMGLLRSINKGTSWTRVNSEEAIGTFIDQNTAGKIYHATKTKILVSNDNGATYSTYYAPVSGVRLFTGGSDATGFTLAMSDFDGANACSWAVKYTNDWGQTSIDQTTGACGYVWTNKNGAGFAKTSQAVGDHLKMAENDSTTIYTTGSTAWIRQYGTKVHVSHDKGQTWGLKLNQIDYDTVPYAPWPSTKLEWSAVALDIGWWDSGYESFEINQRNSSMAAGSGYFFMHSTVNAGENWKAPFTEYADAGIPAVGKKWKTRGLEVISVYKMKFHPTNTNIMYGASADIGGVVSEDHGISFRIPKSAYNSWYDFAFDPADDMVAYGASGSLHDYPNDWHANAATANGGIYKTTDRGRSWTRLTPVDTSYNRQFLSVAYDSKNNIIYGGTQEVGIAVSKNDGATWTYNNAGLPAGNKIIPQIEVDPNTGNVYALLTGDAPTFSNQASTGIYFLDVVHGATSWKLLRGVVNYPKDADAGYKLWFFPTAFAIDFNNPGTLWLVDYENHGQWLATGAWKSTDNGVTWNRVKQITHPTDIKIDPSNNNQVHIASYHQLDGQWGDGGQLYTTDGGATWIKNTVPPLQQNARGVTIDPTDSSKIFYSYFGGGMLYGRNPASAAK
ncbi:MAG: tandem-95 repeat protein [Bacteriovorax sp.]|nr:tandem-95 repeat protein [Bacteriovorax sp.]